MELIEISERPLASSYTPLSQHQEETPDTFFGGPEVLHAYSPEAKLRLSRQQYENTPAVRKLGESNQADAEADVELSGLEIWVSSRYLTIFSPAKSAGIRLPYQTIALHALSEQEGQQCVLLEITPPEANQIPDEDDLEYLDLKLLPLSLAEETQEDEDHAHSSNGVNGNSPSNPVKSIFNAISTCSELNPDPDMEEYEEPSIGTGGWITSENVDQYIDAEGNFTGAPLLGTGAGTVRPREDEEDEQYGDADEEGDGGEDDVMKWRRTE